MLNAVDTACTHCYKVFLRQYSIAVGVTRLQAGQVRNHDLMYGRDKRFF